MRARSWALKKIDEAMMLATKAIVTQPTARARGAVVDQKSYDRRQDEREDCRERERHQHLAAEDESQNQKRRHDQERRQIPD